MTEAIKLLGTFTIDIEIGSGKGEATFKKRRANADMKAAWDKTDPDGFYKYVVDQVVSISGIEDELGPVTIERLKAKDVTLDLINILEFAYLAGCAGPLTAEEAAKNFKLRA